MPDGTPTPPESTYLAGKGYEALVTKEVGENIDFLRTDASPLVDQYGSYANVLSGMTHLNMDRAHYLDLSPFRKNPNLRSPLKRGLTTFAHPWNTGVDLQPLQDTRPNERWKFYLSLELPDQAAQERGQAFFRDLLNLATERKISLMTKSEDHNYDSCNLYTWDQKEMQKALQDLYEVHPNIWQSVPHFFQGPIPGINPEHIGYVQEPIGGRNGSHSTRMAILGRILDIGLAEGKTLDQELFKDAAKTAGVRSNRPWILS